MTIKLLFIDDDPALGRLIQKRLNRVNCDVVLAPDSLQGLAILDQGGIDVVSLDHTMPGQDGLATLVEIMRRDDPPPVVYVTGTNESRVAVAALKAGAVDYLVKDVHGEFVELLEVAIKAACAATKIRRERDAAQQAIKTSRDRFEALAAERHLLLREVNHRVGNSLQLVAAFLHLQSASAEPALRSALSEATRRVHAVAQVHRRLYTADDVQSIALAPYLQGLVGDIRATTDGDSVGSDLSLTADDIGVDPDSAVAIGVIVTELVINALKYAYPDGAGPIRIRLQQHGETALRLAVEDDGAGMPDPSHGQSTGSGIGRTIIDSMASKLNGQVLYEAINPGTRATLTFAHPGGPQSPAAAALG